MLFFILVISPPQNPLGSSRSPGLMAFTVSTQQLVSFLGFVYFALFPTQNSCNVKDSLPRPHLSGRLWYIAPVVKCSLTKQIPSIFSPDRFSSPPRTMLHTSHTASGFFHSLFYPDPRGFSLTPLLATLRFAYRCFAALLLENLWQPEYHCSEIWFNALLHDLSMEFMLVAAIFA